MSTQKQIDTVYAEVPMMRPKSSAFVVCELPKAGLGNQLFPLLKALVFGKLNNLPVKIIGYHQVKIGPYLRREKTKRQYRNYFTFQRSLINERLDALFIKWKERSYQLVREPVVGVVEDKTFKKCIYLFNEIPHWSNYFEYLRENRQQVISLLWSVIHEKVKQDLERLSPPCIGVHIRMGDFRKLKQGEDFSKMGAVRTPEDYFIDIIQQLRAMHGSNLPVSVFTDGYYHEFEKLFTLENITMVQGNTDIVDLLLLSRSKIIVTSAGSTFSYWSGFLSDAPIIIHPDHKQPIRGNNLPGKFYERPIENEALPGLISKMSIY
jgi:hypothetical protein